MLTLSIVIEIVKKWIELNVERIIQVFMMISISLPMHVIDREEEKCRKRYCQKNFTEIIIKVFFLRFKVHKIHRQRDIWSLLTVKVIRF
jgi:hypothetical protein